MKKSLDRVSQRRRLRGWTVGRKKEGPVRRGRPQILPDDELRRRRDVVYGLLEANWAEIGWELGQAKEPDDIAKALAPIARHAPYALSPLAHHATEKTGTQSLKDLRRELSALGEKTTTARKSATTARARFEECRLAAKSTEEVLHQAQKKGEKERASRLTKELDQLREELKFLDEDAIRTQKAYEEVQKLYEKRTKLLEHQEAFSAQVEALRFLQSKRYTRTPLSVANAIAGLPDLRWRRSVARCSKWPAEIGNRRYKAFQILSRILQRPNVADPYEALAAFHKYQNAPRAKDKATVAFLGENIDALEAAMRECWQVPPPDARPFRITHTFFAILDRPTSAVDTILANRGRRRASQQS